MGTLTGIVVGALAAGLLGAALPGRAAEAIAQRSASAQAAEEAQAWKLLGDGAVVLFRHANAPGVGDPPDMRIGDCSTQRNLDEAGRAQARRIGEAFRARRVEVGAVLSSQWCRARDTAQEAFPGRVREEQAFNSFFASREQEPRHTDAARRLVAAWRGPGVLVVVTHQVNISALTQRSTRSGEGIVLQPGRHGLKALGSIATE